jgi:hypothetical protein
MTQRKLGRQILTWETKQYLSQINITEIRQSNEMKLVSIIDEESVDFWADTLFVRQELIILEHKSIYY